MPGIDETLPFQPLNIAILTVSDTRTRANDKSGDVLQGRAESAGHAVVRRDIQTDDLDALVARLDIHHPVSRDGGGESRHLHLRTPGFSRCVSRRMGRHLGGPTGYPTQALQLR